MQNYEINEQSKESITAILTLSRGTRINICYKLFEDICSAPPNLQPNLFRYAAENFDYLDSSEEIDININISKERQEALREIHEDVVDAMLKSLIHRNLCEEDFYKKCWESIVCNHSFFTDKEEQVYALYNILIDSKIPYFQLSNDGLRMSEEEFRKTRKILSREFAFIRFILNREFPQRIEQSSHIVKIFENRNIAEKSSLMAYIINYYERREEYIRNQVIPHIGGE